MEREAIIYIGNAAKFKAENLYHLSGYTATDTGSIYHNGVKLKEYMRDGYKYVYVNINGKRKCCKVHRIIACTFKDICGEYNEVVNHLDENRLNNDARNLQWTTNKENLTWGRIKEKQQETKTLHSEIKEIVRNYYRANNYPVPKKIKITKFKTCFRASINNSSAVIYILGDSLVIDEKRSVMTELNGENTHKYQERKFTEKANNTKIMYLFR